MCAACGVSSCGPVHVGCRVWYRVKQAASRAHTRAGAAGAASHLLLCWASPPASGAGPWPAAARGVPPPPSPQASASGATEVEIVDVNI